MDGIFEQAYHMRGMRRRMDLVVLGLTGAILLALITNVQCQSCPPNVNDDIQRCVIPVAQFAEALGVHTARESSLANDRLIPSMGAEVFRDLCGKITTFSQCSQNARHQCPNHITLALINASYGFLCNDGFEIFMKHADCLMNLDQDPVVRVCHDRTMGTIKNVSRDLKSSMHQKLLVMCDALNYFAVCVEKPVLTECGSIAWSVIERVLRDTTRTLVPSCTFAVTSAPYFTAPLPPPTSAYAKPVSNEQATRNFLSTLKPSQAAAGTRPTTGAEAISASRRDSDMVSTASDSAKWMYNVKLVTSVMVVVMLTR